MKRFPSDRRFVFVKVPTTPSQRRRMKHERIRQAQEALREAMEWVPPLTVTKDEPVLPDDPRYADAPMGEEWIVSDSGFCVEVPK